MSRRQGHARSSLGNSDALETTFVAGGLRLPPAVSKSSQTWSKKSGHANCSPSEKAREWSLCCLLDAPRCGRIHIWQLRDWIETRLQRLKQRCGGQGAGQPALVKYAEQVVDVYNAAFQELTRQVTSGCNDQGQLMADIWTSTHSLLGRILVHVKTQTEGFKAMALALKRKEAVMDDACNRLHQLVVTRTKEVEELRTKMQVLEARLEQAEGALWNQDQVKQKAAVI